MKVGKFIKFLFLPILIIGVAVFQMYISNTTTLVRWKGGGFGMYTDIHPVYNKITINDCLITDAMIKEGSTKRFSLNRKKFLHYPNQNTLNNLIKHTNLSDKDSLTINIYKLKIDLKSNKVNFNTKIYEGLYTKN